MIFGFESMKNKGELISQFFAKICNQKIFIYTNNKYIFENIYNIYIIKEINNIIFKYKTN